MKKDGKMTNIGIATSNSYNFTGLHGETKYEVGIAAKANKVGPMATYTFTTTLGREYTLRILYGGAKI